MITKIIAEELIQKAKKYVEKGDKFVIEKGSLNKGETKPPARFNEGTETL